MPDGMQQLGTKLAEALAPRRSDLVTVSYGTVKAVNETEADVRLDVDLHGGTLYGLPMTTACKGVAVGDRVVVQTYGHLSTVTGVIAHDNSHYVSMQGAWYVLQLGNLVACWIPSVTPSFTGGNAYIRMYSMDFPVEFSDIPTVQVTKTSNSNVGTELQERIEVNSVGTKAVTVKCNAYPWTVADGETTRFSILAVGVA